MNAVVGLIDQRVRDYVPPPPPVPPPQPGGQISLAFREFQNQHPPKFYKGNDIQAEQWLKEIERIWELIPCESQEKA